MCTQLIVSDADVHKVFKSIHQSMMAKIKIYAFEDWIILDVISELLSASIGITNSIKNWDNKEFIAILYRQNICFYKIYAIIVKLIQFYGNNYVFNLKIIFFYIKLLWIIYYLHL